MQVRPLFGSVFFGCLDLLDIYGKTSNCPYWQCLQQIAAIEHSTTPQASHFSSCAPSQQLFWPPYADWLFKRDYFVLFSVVLIGSFLCSWAYMVAMQVRPLFGSVFFGCFDVLDQNARLILSISLPSARPAVTTTWSMIHINAILPLLTSILGLCDQSLEFYFSQWPQ